MSRCYDTKIGKIINEEFDLRMGNAVFSYIMDKGISVIKEITDEEILEIDDNGLMTANFLQSLVRCARRICQECEWFEMIEFIRLYLWCEPTINETTLYQDDYNEEDFNAILYDLGVDKEDLKNGYLTIYAVVDKNCLK